MLFEQARDPQQSGPLSTSVAEFIVAPVWNQILVKA